MKLDKNKEQEVPLLNRKRVSFIVDFEGGPTPSILQIREAVASLLKVKEDLVAIRHVYQNYGSSKAKVIAHVYETRKELMHLEKMKKGEKKALEAEKKAAEEKAKADADAKKAAEEAKKAEAETPKEEAPKEEAPKEEAPKEEEKAE